MVGVLDEVDVLDAVGKIGTAGVLEAAGRTLSAAGEAGVGTSGAVRRIRKATLACSPAPTVTLSSVYPRPGCQARTRYLPGGMPSILNVPFAAVCA